ncbi:MAG: hypothetical protein ACXVA9_10505, partial [Bdellovibrionales bacterium]
MSRLFKRALFLSLALHLTAFLFFRLREARLPSATVPLQIEFKEVPRGHSMSNGKIKSQADPRERGSKFKNILKNMGAGTLNLALNGGAKGAGTNLADYGETGLSEDEWGSHGGRLSQIENFNQYEKLFVHLQGMVDYPGRLGSHGLSD